MANAATIKKMRCELNRQTWRAIGESDDPSCGWANLALVLDGELSRIEAEIEVLLSHGCLTGDCYHEKQSQCDRALHETLDYFRQRLDY